MKEKMIYVTKNNTLMPITDLNRVDYESFLEAMLGLTGEYLKALREANSLTDVSE